MGLLKEALLSSETKKSEKGGLLEKIEKISNKAPTFENWVQLYNLEHVAILDCNASKYFIKKAIGIDSQTLISVISTCDFWNGTLLNNSDWLTAEVGTKQAEPFYQLLSENFVETIKQISFLKLKNSDNSPILMVLSFSEEQKLPKATDILKNELLSYLENKNIVAENSDLKTKDKTKKAFLLLISLKLVIEKVIEDSKIKDSEICDYISSVLYDEILFILKKSMENHHIINRGKNFEIKLIMFMKHIVDATLLQAFLGKVLENILPQKIAEKIIVLSAGNTTKLSVVENFLITG